MVCDIPAGERVSSCEKMCQIKDHKVFYVRFIDAVSTNVPGSRVHVSTNVPGNRVQFSKY